LLELDTQLAIACDLHYLKSEAYAALDEEIYQVLGLLNRLIESYEKKSELIQQLFLETLKP